MTFENDRSEPDPRHGEEFQAQPQGPFMKRMRDKVEDFVAGIKETPSRDTLRNISAAAGVAKDYVNDAAGQAKNYMENASVHGIMRDVAELIKRYPFSAIIVGMTFGFLLSRRREN